MKRFLTFLFWFCILQAQNLELTPLEKLPSIQIKKNSTTSILEDVKNQNSIDIFAQIDDFPEVIYVGEIFSVDFKIYAPIQNNEYRFEFFNGQNITVFKDEQKIEKQGKYISYRFYFEVNSSKAKFFDTVISDTKNNKTLLRKQFKFPPAFIKPVGNFSQLIASDFKITQIIAKSYNEHYNIVNFKAEVQSGNINAFKISDVNESDFVSKDFGVAFSEFSYYAIVNKRKTRIQSSYFNTQLRNFKKFTIPINIVNDEVVTQTDLSPVRSLNTYYKIAILIATSFLLGLIYTQNKSKFWLFLLILPIAILVYLLLPNEKICIKQQTNVRILPFKASRFFTNTQKEQNYDVLGKSRQYYKIKINDNIGWVNEKDLCKN